MEWHSARGFIGASVVLVAHFSASLGLAQTANAWEQCAGRDAATVDQQIDGCTVAIQSGSEAPERLVQALVARAIAYMTKGDYDRAIRYHDQAISLDPKNGLAFNNRGFAYGRIGDFDRAIRDYEHAIRLNPEAALPFFNRGELYAKRGNFDRAIQDYDKAIALNPHFSQAMLNRGFMYAAKVPRRRVALTLLWRANKFEFQFSGGRRPNHRSERPQGPDQGVGDFCLQYLAYVA
jgi:tetratricopeptide (TPR) repeat protein